MNLIQSIQNQTMSSRDIAKLTGKRHDHVLRDVRNMLESLNIQSTHFWGDYKDSKGAQLINLSSRGGYMMVPNAVTYCASKFYVSAFTEGLALELEANQHQLKAKVLAPAATKTEFGQVSTDLKEYDYDEHFAKYHTSEEMAQFLMELYQSHKVVGLVDVENFEFNLSGPLFNH